MISNGIKDVKTITLNENDIKIIDQRLFSDKKL